MNNVSHPLAPRRWTCACIYRVYCRHCYQGYLALIYPGSHFFSLSIVAILPLFIPLHETNEYIVAMATTVSTMFAPHQSSPLTRTTSPLKNPRPPPSTPAKTAKLWDEYERRAIEIARKRDRATQASHPQRSSASDIGKGRKSNDGTTSRSSFDFKFRRVHAATPSTTARPVSNPSHTTPGYANAAQGL
jgi:hypothetical protein